MTRNPLPRCWHLWAWGRRWHRYDQLALGGGRTWWRFQCPNCTRLPVTDGVRIPRDPARRANLFDEAGLTDAERAAVEKVMAEEDREPQPHDGPDYHADHQAWTERQRRDNR